MKTRGGKEVLVKASGGKGHSSLSTGENIFYLVFLPMTQSMCALVFTILNFCTFWSKQRVEQDTASQLREMTIVLKQFNVSKIYFKNQSHSRDLIHRDLINTSQ